uniref:CSN8/PSMD8/EIF3K domain-containing protein n=1 Tax=Clastoptera arizonana TaxID=38151 RepID=A0A1B6CHB9_9HEMI
MVQENFDSLASDLEKEELEASGGVASSQTYAKLLAVYLYQNDLCNAKFLWKRIPLSIKTTNVEVGQIWEVGKAMWQRDFPAVYSAIAAVQWSEGVAPIMKVLREAVHVRATQLVCRAYGSLSITNAAGMLGCTSEQIIQQKDWIIDNQMVSPPRPIPPPSPETSSEEQLSKLTDFVAFLEN